MKSQGHECLQKHRDQRNQNGCRNTEPVNLNLLIRCVSDGHAIEAVPGAEAGRPPAPVGDLASKAPAGVGGPEPRWLRCLKLSPLGTRVASASLPASRQANCRLAW